MMTNGKLITEENLSKFNGDIIAISVLGNKETEPSYKTVTNLDWYTIKEKIILLNSHNIKCLINLNCSSLDEIKIALKDLISDIPLEGVLIGLLDGMPITTDFLLKCRDINKKYPIVRINNVLHFYDHLLTENVWEGFRYPEIANYKCPILNNIVTIDSYGNILTCCADFSMKTIVGNIKNDSILDIFNNKYINNLRKTVSKPEFFNNTCNNVCRVIFNKNKNK